MTIKRKIGNELKLINADELAITSTNPLSISQIIGGSAISSTNPNPFSIIVSDCAVGSTNPLPMYQNVGGSSVGSTNPLPIYHTVAGSSIGSTNPLPMYQTVGGSSIGSTNPVPSNVVIGGAVASTTNPFPMALIVDGAAVSTGNPEPVTLDTVLDQDIDSIDVGKMSKGGLTTAHNAITATTLSSEIDCSGYNAVLILFSITGGANNWTISMQGSMTSGGTFVNWYEMANTGTMTAMSYQTNANAGWIWKGIPDYIKINANEDVSGSTVTITVQPLNV